MAEQTPQPCAIGSESSQTTGASSKAPPAETQQHYRQQLVHCNAAIGDIKNMKQDAHLKILCESGGTKNTKQHAIGCV